jgi:hypothetical protein
MWSSVPVSDLHAPAVPRLWPQAIRSPPKLLKDLVDPNVAPVRALAREERDLVIAANNSHVLAFDNLSGLPHALSSPRARVSDCASSTRTQTRCCFKRRARFFSMALTMSSAGPTSPIAPFSYTTHRRPSATRGEATLA